MTVATPCALTLALPKLTEPAVKVTVPAVAAAVPALTVAVRTSEVPYMEVTGATVSVVVVTAEETVSATAFEVAPLKPESPG